MAAWFEDNELSLEGKPWEEIMELMAIGTLPDGWVRETERLIKNMKMKMSELLDQYFDRGLALFRVVRREGRLTELDLAENLIAGTPKAFSSAIEKERLLYDPRFTFIKF